MTTSPHALRAQAMRTSRVVPAPAIDPAILAERQRAVGLYQLGQQAERMGVTFDASAAIGSRMTIEAARKAVLGSAADGDAETQINTTHTPHMGNETATGDAVKAAWKRGFAAPRK